MISNTEKKFSREDYKRASISIFLLPDEYAEKLRFHHIYLQTASGNGMTLAGVHDGDVLILDKDIHPENGDLVTVEIDGQTLCRRYFQKDGRVYFRRENRRAPDLSPDEYRILGVVITVVKRRRFANPEYNPNIRVKRCREQ